VRQRLPSWVRRHSRSLRFSRLPSSGCCSPTQFTGVWVCRAAIDISVLVLPGLFAGDGYLQPLRRWLWRVGYTPLRSGLKRNPGWSPEVVHELGELAEGGFLRSGQRVSIIGHSLGGLIGRSVALRYRGLFGMLSRSARR
jgi:pimeloyl-ACP methyl ester carboxylesterase